MRTQVIRPGILVALRTTVSGGVSYSRVDLEARQEGDRAVRRWETTSTVEDPEEHERAAKARARARGEILKVVISSTAFGAYLCPLDRESELFAAITRARSITAEFNASAKYTQVTVNAIPARIAATDQEAAISIAGEIRDLLGAMDRGIAAMDPAAIREAASQASKLSAMLSDEQMAQVSDAIDQVRKAARTIVKRVEKGGEDAATVLQDIQRGAIEKARFALLDLDAPEAPTGETMPAVNVARFADLDTCDETAPAEAPSEAPADATGDAPSGESLAASA